MTATATQPAPPPLDRPAERAPVPTPPAEVLAAAEVLLGWLRQVTGTTAAAPRPPVSPSAPAPTPTVGHTPGFETVYWFGHTFRFTPAQRVVVAALWRAWETGRDGIAQLHQNTLLKEADSFSQRLRDIFGHGKHPAWGVMIVQAVRHGGNKGCYMLRAGHAADAEPCRAA